MSSRYTNMWGEDLEEQQKRREWLRQVYDNATTPEKTEQTLITNSGFNQTPYQPDNKEQEEENFNYRKFLNNNSLTNISNSLETTQNQTSYPLYQKEQSNRVSDDVKYRVQSYNNKYQNSNPAMMGLSSMGLKDWVGVIGNAAQGLEREADGLSLGLYSQINKQLGKDYQERKDNYHREAEQAGIGALAKGTDSILEEAASNLGLGKVVSWATSPFKVRKPTKVIMDSAIGSGITDVNRNGSWRDTEEDFRKGMMNSPYIQLMQYFNKHW